MNKIVGWTALMGPPGMPKDVVEIGGIAAIRPPAETERFVREQYELYDKLVGTLGTRQ
jgi:hypothetical protein